MEKPPYTITEKSADYLVKIVEAVTRLELGTSFTRDMRLHRQNRLKTIHASLAIEGNSLTLDEVTAIIEGKVVAGKRAEIREVKNAYEAYDRIMSLNPYSIRDFLKAHKLMTGGLLNESGKFRSGDVGVFAGEVAVHVGARPQFVHGLMAALFNWAKKSELHLLLKSAILHYEIEIIHPFADGNGRMGRLWQTLLLSKWNAVFAWLPMETVLYENRPGYYQAIEKARKADDSGVFIEFTLSALLDALESQPKHKDKRQVERQVEHKDKRQDKRQDKLQVERQVEELTETMIAVLKAVSGKALSRKEIFAALGLAGDSRAFRRNIEPLLTGGYIEMTVPDKPNSKLQKYRLTEKGRGAIGYQYSIS